MTSEAPKRCVPARRIHEFNGESLCQCRAMRDDGEPVAAAVVLVEAAAIAEPPQTFGDLLHAAQLAARQHVSPYLRAAAELALEQGATDDAVFCAWAARVVDGELDPALVRGASAFIRFVQGGSK